MPNSRNRSASVHPLPLNSGSLLKICPARNSRGSKPSGCSCGAFGLGAGAFANARAGRRKARLTKPRAFRRGSSVHYFFPVGERNVHRDGISAACKYSWLWTKSLRTVTGPTQKEGPPAARASGQQGLCESTLRRKALMPPLNAKNGKSRR